LRGSGLPAQPGISSFVLRRLSPGFTNRNLISCIVDPVSLPAASKFLRPELEVVPRERVPKLTAKESEVRKWHEASFAAPQGHI
jgi:hypothetical protein